jgi:hypothetical protein
MGVALRDGETRPSDRLHDGDDERWSRRRSSVGVDREAGDVLGGRLSAKRATQTLDPERAEVAIEVVGSRRQDNGSIPLARARPLSNAAARSRAVGVARDVEASELD